MDRACPALDEHSLNHGQACAQGRAVSPTSRHQKAQSPGFILHLVTVGRLWASVTAVGSGGFSGSCCGTTELSAVQDDGHHLMPVRQQHPRAQGGRVNLSRRCRTSWGREAGTQSPLLKIKSSEGLMTLQKRLWLKQ